MFWISGHWNIFNKSQVKERLIIKIRTILINKNCYLEFTHETTKVKQNSNSVKFLSRRRHCTLQLKSKPDKRQQTTALSNLTDTERYGKRGNHKHS